MEQWLTEKKESRVYLKVPKRGQAKDLVELVGRNALEVLNKQELEESYQEQRTTGALEQLQRALGLPELPHRMECYDISNTQGTDSVASMVVFVDGKPKKDQYRRFKIKTVEGADDYASLREVLLRRLTHGLAEQQDSDKDEGKFAAFPDVIMMDGGRGQVNVALGCIAGIAAGYPGVRHGKR